MTFLDRLAERIAAVDSVVSVGLDPDLERLPDEVADADLPRWQFNRRIIDATHEHAACFKPNAAFYEDPNGWRALRETVAYAHGKGVPVLLDAKRGDIGNTARQYAGVFDEDGLNVDAMTVNPYLGRDALEPYVRREAAGVVLVCRTSNPGGADLQNLELAEGDTLYERVAALADTWNRNDNIMLVVGATAPAELETVREIVPDIPFLVPGIGAQGGDAEAAVEHGLASRDEWPADVGLVNSSRGIIFAGEESEARRASESRAAEPRDSRGDFFEAAGEAAKRLKSQLNQYRD